MNEMVDVATQLVSVRRRDAEHRLGQVTDQRLDLVAEPCQLADRGAADQNQDSGAVALGEQVNQMPADESGAAGHEIGRHGSSLPPSQHLLHLSGSWPLGLWQLRVR